MKKMHALVQLEEQTPRIKEGIEYTAGRLKKARG
jgi:hypothetical protein